MPESIAGLGTIQPTGLHGSVDTDMSALGGMDSSGFLNLLVAQLRYQSPLDPKDPGDLMVQTAALAQLDASQQLLALQQRDMGMQQAVAAAGLVGVEITATSGDGTIIEGTVDAVRYTALGPVLEVAGQEIHLGDVSEIRRHGFVPATEPATEPETAPDATASPEPSTIDS